MPRIDAAILLGVGLWLACSACGDDSPVERQGAPNEGAVPSAGKASSPDDSGSGGSNHDAPDPPAAGGAAPFPSEDAAGASGEAPQDWGVGTKLSIDVDADEPTYVNLAAAEVVDGEDSRGWDLVFRGWEIFTNGGESGSGKGAAFGPLPFTYLVAGEDPPEIPFLIEDKAAGAFLDWYFYDGQWHALYSRFHRYGVKSGSRVFKVQLLGYYGDVQGAPISALYHLRYAEVTPDSSGDVIDVDRLDATAGGLGGDGTATSGCLSLISGQTSQLTPSEAAASTRWDLLFRRDSISVNGGRGGPGDVEAVDLDASETAGETLDVIKARTPENQADAFAAVDHDALTAPGLKYRGDRVVSAFTEAWADLTAEPPTLAKDDTWLVVGADGTSRFLVGFVGLENSTAERPGQVVMRIVKVR